MLYGAEAVAYLVQRLYQSLSDEMVAVLHLLCPQYIQGDAENLVKE